MKFEKTTIKNCSDWYVENG